MGLGNRTAVAAAIAGLGAGALLVPAGVNAAGKVIQDVFITNTAENPVPVAGTVAVSGRPAVDVGTPTVKLDGTPQVNVGTPTVKLDGTPKVDVGTPTVKVEGPVQTTAGEVGERFVHSGEIVIDDGTIEKFQDVPIPAGKRLLVDYVSARSIDDLQDKSRLSLLSLRANNSRNDIWMPLHDNGEQTVASEPVSLDAGQLTMHARRVTEATFVAVDYTITGTLVDAP